MSIIRLTRNSNEALYLNVLHLVWYYEDAVDGGSWVVAETNPAASSCPSRIHVNETTQQISCMISASGVRIIEKA